MASLLAAVMDKFDNLGATNFPGGVVPPIYHDIAAQISVNVQQKPPFAVVSLQSNAADLCFESLLSTETVVKFSLYYEDENDLDMAIAAIRFNGQPLDNNAGFDNGTLPALSPEILVSMLLSNTPVKFFDAIDGLQKNIYRGEVSYDVMTEQS